MRKINDRIYLGMISGAAGLVALTLIDVVSSKMGISQRSYRTTAGVWVSSRREAEKWSGQLLGVMMNIGLSMVGGVSVVKILTRYGRDKLVPKGLFFGITFGSVITAMVSGFAKNKVKPKDAISNLSYYLSHAAFGLVSIFTAAKLGDDSLFDAQPQNDYIKPTNKTSEQINGSKRNNVQPIYSGVNPNLEETTLTM